MTKKLYLLIVFLGLSGSAFAQVDQTYQKTLEEMFKVSGSEESYQATISQIFTMFKQQYPDIEESILTDFEKEFSNESMKELSMLLVPIYKKYMTLSDLNEMIRFYKTPVGKKFAKNTPLIMQESTQIGQQWALEMGQVFEKKLKSKGYL